MKKIIYILFIHLIVACNTGSQNANKSEVQTQNKKGNVEKATLGGNNIGLLKNYECDMTEGEIAKVLEVNEQDLKLVTYDDNKTCYVDLKGYGANASRLSWRLLPGNKKSHKKMITDQLEYKEQNISIAGMSIELAETGDCYLSYQPLAGRVFILNENYDMAFMISYGTKVTNIGRTKEQHEDLKNKMTDLANYLLRKYRK